MVRELDGTRKSRAIKWRSILYFLLYGSKALALISEKGNKGSELVSRPTKEGTQVADFVHSFELLKCASTIQFTLA